LNTHHDGAMVGRLVVLCAGACTVGAGEVLGEKDGSSEGTSTDGVKLGAAEGDDGDTEGRGDMLSTGACVVGMAEGASEIVGAADVGTTEGDREMDGTGEG